MKKYNHEKIEKKWQKEWKKNKLYQTKNETDKPKYYILDMFPYPSGAGLHVGHPKGYIATDILARQKMLQGYNVLHPMGWDAFGLPAENFAIKNKVHPREMNEKNIATFKSQLEKIGFTYDWDREINTTDPEYYKWTQWTFLQMFKKGLAYESYEPINWCPKCQTGLANEDLENGKCERCDSEIEQKPMRQWVLKITDYAERMLKDLDKLQNWPESIKEMQKNWIGKSEGAKIKFPIKEEKLRTEVVPRGGVKRSKTTEEVRPREVISEIEVFTTRPDTLFGATYLVLAPEHELVEKILSEAREEVVPRGGGIGSEADNSDGRGATSGSVERINISNYKEVKKYVEQTKNKTEMERMENKEKTGVELKGVKAINPANQEEIPVYIADYVLADYGTGAIMAVPAHDERDFEFAQKMGIKIKQVIAPDDYNQETNDRKQLNVILMHGWGGHGKMGWFKEVKKFLTNKNIDVIAPDFPNTDSPKYQEWRDFFKKNIQPKINDQTVFIGHSLAPSFLMHYITEENLQLQQAIFVAPVLHNRISELNNFFEKDFNWSKIKKLIKKVIVLGSDDDLYITLNDFQELSEKLSAKFILHKNRGHFSQNENSNPEIIKLLEEILDSQNSNIQSKFKIQNSKLYTGVGILINSEQFDGMNSEEAKKAITKFVGGEMTVNYKLKDWVFSRQRYWGEPIPIIHCDKCGVVPVPEEELPVKLPDVENYEPTGTGESPLANIDEWVNTKCPKCGGEAKRETNTMPQWAGSSWYYLRYIDPKNNKALVDKKKEKYWSPVDFYIGGAEHATRHLIYARFWHKFLFDIGVVNYEEPFTRLQNVGLIMAEDGRKMSKRWGNVINPDDIVDEFGADAMRVYEMFMGPFAQSVAWNTKGLIGARRFLEKVWRLFQEKELVECGGGRCGDVPKEIPPLFHKTIKKVTEDIESMNFNTAISQMMIFVNECMKHDILPKSAMERFLILLAPFAPHITEELWAELGAREEVVPRGGGIGSEADNSDGRGATSRNAEFSSIFLEEWPKYNPDMIKDEMFEMVVQVNGKVRDKVQVSADISEEEANEKALASEKVQKYVDGKEIKKVIFIKGRLLNLVI